MSAMRHAALRYAIKPQTLFTALLLAGAIAACGGSSTGPDGTVTAHADATVQSEAASISKPSIEWMRIPFDTKRKRETAAYSKRHYGRRIYRLSEPKVIVQHFTVNDSVTATYNTFAPDNPDPELHELPGVCAHFVISKTGRIFQFVSLRLICRHTVGLNYTAIGIEHVGRSDADVMDNKRQLRASLRLTAWLRCRYGIERKDVIGHNESLSSPYHHENVASLRNQTHGDFVRATMKKYRKKLLSYSC